MTQTTQFDRVTLSAFADSCLRRSGQFEQAGSFDQAGEEALLAARAYADAGESDLAQWAIGRGRDMVLRADRARVVLAWRIARATMNVVGRAIGQVVAAGGIAPGAAWWAYETRRAIRAGDIDLVRQCVEMTSKTILPHSGWAGRTLAAYAARLA